MSDCIEWKGRKNKQGYGIIKIKGIDFGVHRLSWTLHNGRSPRKLLVCHHCDNPSCINPEHLFVGTYKDNSQDMVSKNRQHRWNGQRRGIKNPFARLNPNKVEKIRELLSQKLSHRKIGKLFGIGHRTVTDIALKRTWSYADNAHP
jgi:hypothetical protein